MLHNQCQKLVGVLAPKRKYTYHYYSYWCMYGLQVYMTRLTISKPVIFNFPMPDTVHTHSASALIGTSPMHTRTHTQTCTNIRSQM